MLTIRDIQLKFCWMINILRWVIGGMTFLLRLIPTTGDVAISRNHLDPGRVYASVVDIALLEPWVPRTAIEEKDQGEQDDPCTPVVSSKKSDLSFNVWMVRLH
jgi:hypothetical protein